MAMPISAQPSDTQLTDAHLRKALAYWQRKRGKRHMPRRADIDPVEMPDLLPYVRLVDVVAPGQYRYRLVGTEVEQFHGGLKFNGRFVHEALPPALAERIIPVYDDCVRERRPVFLENTFLVPDTERVARHSRVIYLPLSEDDQTVSMVLVVQVFAAIEPGAPYAFDPWATHYTEIQRRVL
jgi:hypothetical protein